MFMRTMAVGPLEEVASCVTGGTVARNLRGVLRYSVEVDDALTIRSIERRERLRRARLTPAMWVMREGPTRERWV